jgi:hypothetical protein
MAYVTRATRYSADLDDDVMDHSLTVYDEDDSRPTGILDKHGNELWWVSDKAPMGFCR